MFTPQTFSVALVMMVVTAICWGSWANTFKGVKNYRFELFYWDYAIGIFLASLVYAFTMGSTGNDASSFLNNVRGADAANIGWALLAGVIFNLANLLLVAGIDLAGLATAFPVSIGIALVVGTVLSYILQPEGNRATARRWRAVRVGGCDSRRQSVRASHRRQGSFTQEHCSVRGIGRVDGIVGAIFHARDDARKCAGAVQHRRVSHAGRAGVVPRLECVFHAQPAGGHAGRVQRIFQGTC